MIPASARLPEYQAQADMRLSRALVMGLAT